MDDHVTAMCRRALGHRPDRVTAAPVGIRHDTYLVECEDGEYVLQVAAPGERTRLRRGLCCYRLLADSPVPVPAVVTEQVRTLDGRPYVVVERLPGTPGERAVSPGRARNAGRALARLHGARGFETPGRLRVPDVDSATVTPGDDLPGDAVTEYVATLRETGLDAAAGAAANLFDDRERPTPRELRLCHDDFSPDNVLFDGDRVTGVLDLDRAYAGDPRRDLAKAATAFWLHDPCADWDVREAVYAGYRAERGDESFARVEPYYRVETLAESVAWLADASGLDETEREVYGPALTAAVKRARAATPPD